MKERELRFPSEIICCKLCALLTAKKMIKTGVTNVLQTFCDFVVKLYH